MPKPKSSHKPTKKPRKPNLDPAPPLDPTSDAALLSLPLTFADPPDIPVDVARRELASLARLATIAAPDLAKIGIPPATLELAARFAVALGRKEKVWQRARKDVALKTSEHKLLAEAEALDAKLVAGGRWALRGDRAAQAELTRIAEGAGLVDTLQDLRDLQAFWREHAEHRSKTLITDKDLARVAKLIDELESAAQREAANVEAARALDLRNRAFWAAHELAQEIREGGRYVHASQPKLAAKFTSRYRSTVVRGSRRKKATRSAAPLAEASASPSE